jgi:bifunctional UDP-N-acetylglucosamine pyrophosphorylase/glucosamine-1-phosphate N-acetyltransferase
VEASEWEGDKFAPAEVNAGVYCFNRSWLDGSLANVYPSPNGEKYLTALAGMGTAAGSRIDALPSEMPEEIFGVNDRVQLAQVEAIKRWQICEGWMRAGVTIQDPASVFIDAAVAIGQDTVIRPNTMLLGRAVIGEDCEIGPNSVIQNSRVGHRCRIIASMVEESTLEDEVDIGPFSHLRPAAHLERGVHIGNFVEVKESRLGAGTLAGHFSYLGDAAIGANVNIGAGAITCNYDGRDKHRTTIGSGAFIGCDTMLVAPVTVAADAATGAGSVVTKDVPQGLLAVGVPARIRPRKPQTDQIGTN